MSELSSKSCVPCAGGVPPLSESERERLLPQLDGEWQVVEGHHLERTLRFDDFMGALEMANKVGELAEEEGHHPDLLVRWGELGVKIWTHKIDGLTESDFILAAKVDRLAERGDQES